MTWDEALHLFGHEAGMAPGLRFLLRIMNPLCQMRQGNILYRMHSCIKLSPPPGSSCNFQMG